MYVSNKGPAFVNFPAMCVTTHGAQPLKSAGLDTACGEEPGMVGARLGVRPSSAGLPKG